MAIQLNDRAPTLDKVLEVQISGKLTHEDYEVYGPMAEQMIHDHGKIRVLLNMVDFHGWDARALWDDIKFEAKHFRDIERVAMVGDKKWEKTMSTLCKPFTTAKVRFFARGDLEAARSWLSKDEEAGA